MREVVEVLEVMVENKLDVIDYTAEELQQEVMNGKAVLIDKKKFISMLAFRLDMPEFEIRSLLE